MRLYYCYTKDLNVEGLLQSKILTDADYDRITRIKNEEVQKEQLLSTYFKRKYVGEYHLNEYGKPLSDNVFFNISHTKGMVIIAIDSLPIGVDIETLRKTDDKLVKYVCSPDEELYIKNALDFYNIWTNKESLVKCIGTGIRTKVNEIPGLPLNDIREFVGKKYRSKTFDLFNYTVSVTRDSILDFDIELIQERLSF